MYGQRKSILNESEKAKSGNYKDAFAKFLQIALKNSDINEKGVEFNSTIFGIKAEFNEKFATDSNFVRETFSRNFQINLKANLDNEFNYSGISAGVTYAFINGRDDKVVSFIDTPYSEKFELLRKALTRIQATLVLSNPKDEELIDSAGNDLFSGKPFDISLNPYYQKITDSFKEQAIGFGIENNNLIAYVKSLNEIEKEFYEAIAAKPLWTISAKGSSDKEGSFNKATFESIFLRGNDKAWYEVDVRGKLTFDDTISKTTSPTARLIGDKNTLTRTTANFKAGVNFRIKSPFNPAKRILEIKVYGEYNYILNNVPEGKKKENFLANSDIRLRLTDDLWLPFTIKYDTENSNLLGFLNITYNFE